MDSKNLKAIIKVLELANEETTIGNLKQLMDTDTITTNKARNGREVIWYMTELTNICVYTDTIEELSEAEIEDQLC